MIRTWWTQAMASLPAPLARCLVAHEVGHEAAGTVVQMFY